MRRWAVRPRLESLEVRTLPTTAMFEPPALPVRAANIPPAASTVEQSMEGSSNPGDSIPAGIDAIVLDNAGLSLLLQDLRTLTPPMQQEAPLYGDPAAAFPAKPTPGLPPSIYGVVTTGTSAIDSGAPAASVVAAAPSPPPQLSVGHVVANPPGEGNLGDPDGATTLPAASATSELRSTTTSASTPNTPAVANAVGSWMPPVARIAADASSMGPVAEAEPPSVAWLIPDTATPPAPAPEAPSNDVWSFPGAGSEALPWPTLPPSATAAPTLTASATTASPEAPPEATAVPVEVYGLPTTLADGVLLGRYVAQHDQTAFAALVARHEQLVFNICQRVLGDVQAAEDALQATFLVLARKASVLDPHRPLTGWLYMVAYHVALRLRAIAARRRRSEAHAVGNRTTHDDSEVTADLENAEVHQALREEVQRLPEKLRAPLVLCYFQGQTHAEAARNIGMPRGSIAKRIGEGLQRLRQRLTDRGITL